MILAGTLIGSAWLGIDSGPWAAHALGGALLLYAVYGLSGPTMKVRPAWEVWLGPLCGLVTGLVTAATGVFVMPAVPYLQSLGLSRDEMVRPWACRSRCPRWRWPWAWPVRMPSADRRLAHHC